MVSKYLYCKVKTCNKKFISLTLDSTEIDFLKKNNIPFYKNGNRHCVNLEKLKLQFYPSS